MLPPREGGTVRLRIFTPRVELRFAGHPCLGAAFVLGGPLQLGVLGLETGSGIVPVELERDESGRIVFGWMTQPVPTVEPYERAEELLAALGLAASELPVEVYDNGVRHAYAVLPAKEDVARLEPTWRTLAGLDVVGVSACAGTGTSWKLRMFAPAPASARTPRPARRPGRSPATSPATASSRGARRSRSSRGPRSTGPRASSRGRPARVRRSSRCRSGARL